MSATLAVTRGGVGRSRRGSRPERRARRAPPADGGVSALGRGIPASRGARERRVRSTSCSRAPRGLAADRQRPRHRRACRPRPRRAPGDARVRCPAVARAHPSRRGWPRERAASSAPMGGPAAGDQTPTCRPRRMGPASSGARAGPTGGRGSGRVGRSAPRGARRLRRVHRRGARQRRDHVDAADRPTLLATASGGRS